MQLFSFTVDVTGLEYTEKADVHKMQYKTCNVQACLGIYMYVNGIFLFTKLKKSNYLVGTCCYKNKVDSLYHSRAVPPEIILLPVDKSSSTETLWTPVMVTRMVLEALHY